MLKNKFTGDFPAFTGLYEEPASDEEVNLGVTFKNFMNYHTGLNKSVAEYLAFQKACEEYNGDGWNCDSLQNTVVDFYLEEPDTGTGGSLPVTFSQRFSMTGLVQISLMKQ
ncbi:MAG: hypothetical protein WDO71_19445 [Bacteroidota bacterium]